MTGFMSQKGTVIVCGNAGPGLGDSMYEGRIFVGGEIQELGNDAVVEEPDEEEREFLTRNLEPRGLPGPLHLQEGRLRSAALELQPQGAGSLEGGLVTEPKATRQSGIYSPGVIEDIQTKAELGRYRIRGFGTLRTRPMPSLDDLVFIPCTLTRIPLEGYREKCSTRTVLGTRHAEKPIVLDTPVMVTGMSYGALSYNAKVALALGASRVGSSTTTGDGGMLPAEREHSDVLIYEVLPSRYGIDVHHMKAADGIELTIGQGAKPGTGGMLLGSKVSSEIAGMRDLPDRRRPAESLPSPRLPGSRRHDHQDRGVAGGHRLAGAHLRQDGGPPASTTTSSWRPRRGRTWWWWTAWRGEPARRPTCSWTTPASPHWRRSARPAPPWRTWASSARCN